MAVALAVVAVIGGSYVLTNGFGLSHGSHRIQLLPVDAYYSIPGGQFSAVAISVQKASVVNGTFDNTEGITLYELTPPELVALSKTNVVSGYTWTSGRIANLTVTDLYLPVQPGQWDLVFLNTAGVSLYNTTIVTFYTGLVLFPS